MKRRLALQPGERGLVRWGPGRTLCAGGGSGCPPRRAGDDIQATPVKTPAFPWPKIFRAANFFPVPYHSHPKRPPKPPKPIYVRPPKQSREQKLAKARAYSKEWYAKKVGRPVGKKGRLPYVDHAARKAARLQAVAAKKAKLLSVCRKCGNDRLKRPDIQGRCSRCYHLKQKRHRTRVKASPKARALHRAARIVYRNRRRANGGKLTAAEWRAILEKYGNRCVSCGSPKNIELDHIVPLAHGGRHIASNVQPLCAKCNLFKLARHIDYRPCPGRPGPSLPPLR